MGSRDYIAARIMNSDAAKRAHVKESDGLHSEQARLAKSCLQNTESIVLTAANEPSLALYRIQEHVRKSVVQLVERKEISKSLSEKKKGAIYDTDYAIGASTSLSTSLSTFKTINSDLKNAIHLSQQIAHNQRRQPVHQRPPL